jgi:hypothetical protein
MQVNGTWHSDITQITRAGFTCPLEHHLSYAPEPKSIASSPTSSLTKSYQNMSGSRVVERKAQADLKVPYHVFIQVLVFHPIGRTSAGFRLNQRPSSPGRGA